MAVPASFSQPVVSSMGCVGNRTFTGLPDSELYTAISGTQIGAIAEHLAAIVTANATLATFYEQRRIALTTM
jgi:uncharacterized protein (DUF169 family)